MQKTNLITQENIAEIVSQLPAPNDPKISENTVLDTPIGRMIKAKVFRGETQFFAWCLLPIAPIVCEPKKEGKLIL